MQRAATLRAYHPPVKLAGAADLQALAGEVRGFAGDQYRPTVDKGADFSKHAAKFALVSDSWASE